MKAGVVRRHRGNPLQVSRKKKGGGGELEDVGYFQASKLLKLALLSSLMRKYMLWKGFYHDFSTWKE